MSNFSCSAIQCRYHFQENVIMGKNKFTQFTFTVVGRNILFKKYLYETHTDLRTKWTNLSFTNLFIQIKLAKKILVHFVLISICVLPLYLMVHNTKRLWFSSIKQNFAIAPLRSDYLYKTLLYSLISPLVLLYLLYQTLSFGFFVQFSCNYPLFTKHI